jgi:putative addiction module killer protein
MIEIRRYVTETGKDLIGGWLTGIRDARTRAKIAARIARLSAGNFGDCKPVRAGVWELRVNWGPGYRVYYAMIDRSSGLLLCGGDKRRQSTDIQRAIRYWLDYQRRTQRP